jgi:preprotein translocase subunit SecA
MFGGTKSEKDLATYSPVVEQVNAFYQEVQSLSNDELRLKTLEFKERIAEYLSGIDEDIKTVTTQAKEEADFHKKDALFKQVDTLKKERDENLEVVLRQILPEAFAVVKEAASRLSQNETLEVTATDHDRFLAGKGKMHVKIQNDKAYWSNTWKAAGSDIRWNMVHFDVQLIGGSALHDGKIAEMATGEGKTLVSTLPAYLNALAGEGVHIVTVNDYLAKRDSEWNGPLYEFLMLTVDCIDKHKPNSADRRAAYGADITYGTNNEFGFDYLRDNMVTSPDELVQRKHHYAMVDEVDSVLIDDARTPLIISGPVPPHVVDAEYAGLKPKVEKLIEVQRGLATQFLTEARKKIADGVSGPNEGEGGLALFRSYRALPKNRALIKFLSEDGIRVILQKTENFYMQEQSRNMHVADAPLFFTLDEKNRNVELTDKGAEYLSKGESDPSFFIMPNLSLELQALDNNRELTQEEKEEAKEMLSQNFSLKSSRLHAISQLLKAYALFEKDEEYVVMDGEVKIVDEQTGRIMDGRRYSDGLHQALEAKENVKVGELTQTYATVTLQNYFRMYHKLAGMTGTAETEAVEFDKIYKLDVVVVPTNKKVVRKDLDDFVYKTNREKYNAVIDEIERLQNAGRPILVGTTSVEISEKLSRILQTRGVAHNVLNAKQHAREAEIVAEAGLPGKVTIATNMAGRGTDIKISAEVKAAGGLAIIGTERHESRRVDRQLRGRAGRQGDPGTSQFFVSLEDNLMRLFNSERIAKLMDKMGHKEGEVIQHSMVTSSIERAQKKVEENNFGVRKRLLEYDDVMNIQREAIYSKRDNALNGERLALDLNTMIFSMAENLIIGHRQGGDFQSFRQDSIAKLGFDPDMDEGAFMQKSEDSAVDQYFDQLMSFYERKMQRIREDLFPIVQDVYEKEGHRYKRMLIPFMDRSGMELPISCSLEEAVKTNGESITLDIEKTITLFLIDDSWKEHLRNMDELKESVQGANFEQKDPLVIYKMEGYKLFEEVIQKINAEVTGYLFRGTLTLNDNPVPEPQRKAPAGPKVQTNREIEDSQERARAAAQNAGQPQQIQTMKRVDPKIGRNDACPCGSGKKYKNCHGQE